MKKEKEEKTYLAPFLTAGTRTKYLMGAVEQRELIALYGEELSRYRDLTSLPQEMRRRLISQTLLKAGKDSADLMVWIAGSLTVIQNVIRYIIGQYTAEEAIKNTAISFGEQAVTGYLSGIGGAVFSSILQSSENAIVQVIGKTALPQLVVIAAIKGPVEAISQYLQGNISGSECLSRVRQSAVRTLVGSSAGLAAGKAAISLIAKRQAANSASLTINTACAASTGKMLIPIPALSAFATGAAGLICVNALYSSFLTALRDAEAAKQQRLAVEKECETAMHLIRQYRMDMQTFISAYLQEYQSAFDEAFDTIGKAWDEGNADGVIDGANQITRKLGGTPEFNSVKEFEKRMKDDEPLKL